MRRLQYQFHGVDYNINSTECGFCAGDVLNHCYSIGYQNYTQCRINAENSGSQCYSQWGEQGSLRKATHDYYDYWLGCDYMSEPDRTACNNYVDGLTAIDQASQSDPYFCVSSGPGYPGCACVEWIAEEECSNELGQSQTACYDAAFDPFYGGYAHCDALWP
jgi:hypothetical protein